MGNQTRSLLLNSHSVILTGLTISICKLKMIFSFSPLSICSVLLFSMTNADLCPEPEVTNGQVSGRTSPDFFYGQVRCNVGFHLVGNPVIKCRAGTWSGTIPVCAAIGSCPTLPLVENGRNIPIRGSRQSAVRFSCYRGFRLVGEKISHCMGERWSVGRLPVCARATCEEEGMEDIPFGEARRQEEGAVYRYQCEEGVPMEGSCMLYWNGTVPSCLVSPSTPELEILPSVTLAATDSVTIVVPGYQVCRSQHSRQIRNKSKHESSSRHNTRATTS